MHDGDAALEKPVPRRRSAGFRTGVLAAAGAALVALVAYLLLTHYRSSLTLREHLVSQRSQKVRADAASLGFFFAAATEELRFLGASSEVQAFYENRDLGMSPQYGLALSLVALRERVEALVHPPDGAAPRFLRVAVLDEDRTVLADSGGGEGAAWRIDLAEAVHGVPGEVRLAGDGQHLRIVRRHRFKGRDAGWFVAWLRPDAVLAALGGDTTAEHGSRLVLVDPAGRPYLPPIGSLLSAEPAGAAPTVKVQIPRQPLWLAKYDPEASLVGELSPTQSALQLAVAAAAVLAVLGVALLLNTRALVLETRLEASLQREAAVAEKHAALERATAERQQLEEQLRHAQKLEAIGTLAGGVAHDFNNLLTAIQVNAGFALEGLAPGDPVRDDVAQIQKAATRAVELTRQLLAFGRKQVLKPQVLDLDSVVAGVEKMVRALLGEHVALEIRADGGLRRVRADPGQLEQVILNLAVNARDAMPGGGHLRLATSNVTVDAADARSAGGTAGGDYVRLSVTDDGVGMSPETQARIFEPFFTTKERGKGTGLGLATVYGIVTQSRGFMKVSSAPGRGTTFDVFLPAEQVAATPLPARSAPVVDREPSGRGETVLLAEDDEQVREVVRRQLADEGFSVLVAADGEDALRVLEAHRAAVDVLLSDVVMPRVSGPELARRFRERHPAAAVVLMSAYSEEAVVRQGDLGPRTAFVGKPYDRAELMATLRVLLDGRAGDHRLAS